MLPTPVGIYSLPDRELLGLPLQAFTSTEVLLQCSEIRGPVLNTSPPAEVESLIDCSGQLDS